MSRPASRQPPPEKPERVRPVVEHIIDDHAGTVLDEVPPAPSLTRQEERRVLRVYKEVMLAPAKPGKKAAKAAPKPEEGDEQADPLTETAAVEDDAPPGEGEEEEEEKEEEDPEAAAAAKATAKAEAEAAAEAARAAAAAGMTLEDVRLALPLLDVRLSEEQFDAHVAAFFRAHGLGGEGDRLELEGFVALVSVVYCPGHKFGARLRKACARADDALCLEYLSRGCNPLGFDGGGFTALHYAAQFGQKGTVAALLDFAKDPPEAFVASLTVKGPEKDAEGGGDREEEEEEDDDEEEEASSDESEAEEEKGGDGSSGGTNTGEASEEGKEAAKPAGKFGVYYDAMIEATDTSGWTPLMVAAAYGQAEALALLLEAGGDVRAATRDAEGDIGRTALHWAAAKGKEECVGVLVKAGADANAADASGWTPLHCALFHGHADCAAALVTKHKANMLQEDKIGRTPQSYCLPRTWAAFEEAKEGTLGKPKRAAKAK